MSRSFKDSLRSRVATKKYTFLILLLCNYINVSFLKDSLRSRVATKNIYIPYLPIM
jgi:hypothetical protein